MKKVFSFFLIMLLCLPVFAADIIYVRQKSGDTLLSISNIKEITFPSGSVVVSMTDGSSKTYSSSNFVSLRFNGNATVGIDGVEDGANGIVYDGVVVKAPQEGISIYSTDGRLVLSTEESELNVSSLANGIYIVKANGLTSKIVK
ncbi:MAG: T9SS type A sorting domain-containing protein [Muribaculaceae bacterium]|nr:T9SS type A sorting domain-containing protein [Muribaculaceae bacterium]